MKAESDLEKESRGACSLHLRGKAANLLSDLTPHTLGLLKKRPACMRGE